MPWAGTEGSSGLAAGTRRPVSAVVSEGSGRVEIVIKGARFTEADAEAQVHGICFKTGPPQRVGVELEWLARDPRDPALPVQAEQVTATLAASAARTKKVTRGKKPTPFGMNPLLFLLVPRSRSSLAGSLSSARRPPLRSVSSSR